MKTEAMAPASTVKYEPRKCDVGRMCARSPLKMRFGQEHVNAFIAVNKLGHAQVARERAQHVSFVARQIGARANVFDHLPYRLFGRVVEIFVEADGYQMGRTFGKRPG